MGPEQALLSSKLPRTLTIAAALLNSWHAMHRSNRIFTTLFDQDVGVVPVVKWSVVSRLPAWSSARTLTKYVVRDVRNESVAVVAPKPVVTARRDENAVP